MNSKDTEATTAFILMLVKISHVKMGAKINYTIKYLK